MSAASDSDPMPRDAMSDALGDQVTPRLKQLADLVQSLLERVGPIEERLGRIEQRLDSIAELDEMEREDEA